MMKRISVLMFVLVTLLSTNTFAAKNKSNPQPSTIPTKKVLEQSHPWYGARVAFLGDSQTDPNNDGSQMKYWGFLSQWLDISPYVYGVSGHQWSEIPGQINKLYSEHQEDVDAIIIMAGTNDYNQGIRIGSWYEYGDTTVEAAYGYMKRPEYRHHRKLSYDPNTFCGRINIAMRLVKQLYSDKQVILLTPIHRAFFDGGEKNLQPDEDIANRGGLYQEAYVQCVKEAGNVWAVPVIDTNAISGFYPLINGTLYYHNANDLLHPNDAGHKRLATTLLWQLSSFPCRF